VRSWPQAEQLLFRTAACFNEMEIQLMQLFLYASNLLIFMTVAYNYQIVANQVTLFSPVQLWGFMYLLILPPTSIIIVNYYRIFHDADPAIFVNCYQLSLLSNTGLKNFLSTVLIFPTFGALLESVLITSMFIQVFINGSSHEGFDYDFQSYQYMVYLLLSLRIVVVVFMQMSLSVKEGLTLAAL